MAKAPGRNDREDMTVRELLDRFPSEDAAREWFEAQIWPNGRHCPRCGYAGTPAHETMPYHCPICRRYFGARIGTLMERSQVSLRDWAIAIHLYLKIIALESDRDLIWALTCRLAEEGPEAEQIRSVVKTAVTGEVPEPGGILSALRRSPMVDTDLDLSRLREEGRKVEL